jgi:hypothetical protein
MSYPTIFEICNAYESGVGHGKNNDGHEKGPFSNKKLNEAYEIGYNFGFEKYFENLKTFKDVLNNL